MAINEFTAQKKSALFATLGQMERFKKKMEKLLLFPHKLLFTFGHAQISAEP